MSVDLSEFVNRIPREKLTEIVDGFTAGTTAQQIIESLSAAGVEASEEEAQALVASLLLKDDEMREIPEDDLEMIAGGGSPNQSGASWFKEIAENGIMYWAYYRCPGCYY